MTADPTSQARLTCAEVEPLLPLVADGALDDQGDPELFLHLAECPHCQDLLASHDLLTLALERTPPAPVRKIIRWPLPLALAAGFLAAAISGWLMMPPATASGAGIAVAQAPPPTAPPVPTVESAPVDNPVIEIDVAAVASPIPGRTMYLVRRGEQVLLVDPVAGTAKPPPTDATPATYRRY